MASLNSFHYFLLILVGTLLVGCGGTDASSGRQSQSSNLRLLISLHNYATTKLGHPPKSQEEFEQFIAQNCQETLERNGLGSAKDLFVSERSGQPLVVIYSPRPEGVSSDVVAYEKEGVDGSRQVGFELGRIQKINETQFLELVPVVAE